MVFDKSQHNYDVNIVYILKFYFVINLCVVQHDLIFSLITSHIVIFCHILHISL
jgi:hypothetical protein